MKNIILKCFACVIILVLIVCTLASCVEDPASPHCPPDSNRDDVIELTNEDVLNILEVAARDYVGIELGELAEEKGKVSLTPFIKLNQDKFFSLEDKDLTENSVLTDSQYFFAEAVIAAHRIVSNYEDFKLGKIYNTSIVNAEGNVLEDQKICPVGIISADDGGIYLLYFKDSVITNETIQVTYYLAVENNNAIVKSSAIYAGPDSEEKGSVIVDYVQFAGDTVETASVMFTLETPSEAREVSKIINANPDGMKEIKANVVYLEYVYASVVNDIVAAKGNEFTTENCWTEFMSTIFDRLIASVRTYGADFRVIFTENLTEITLPEIVEVVPEETTPDSTDEFDGGETTESTENETTNTESESAEDEPSETDFEVTE